MRKTSQNAVLAISQIHVRVSSELKKVLKMFCGREGTTEQAWLLDLIKAEMTNQAPDLWPLQQSSSASVPTRAERELSGVRRTRRAR